MFSYKMQNVEEQCQVARKREEEAREETSNLQNKCDGLETEMRNLKKRGEESRSAFVNMTKMMREVEERSTEGAMEREKEIERLQQRCKVLGEAVGRLSGASGKDADVDTVQEETNTTTKAALADHEAWYEQQRKERMTLTAQPEQLDMYDFDHVPPSPVMVSPFPEKLRAKVDNAKRGGKRARAKKKREGS